MAEGVYIRLEGADTAIAALEKAAAIAEHPRDLYDAIGAALVVSTQHRFERGEGPDGSPWPPSFRVLTEGGKTLMDTLALVGSITHEADDKGVRVGTNAIHAAVHQFGATIVPVNAKSLAFRLGDQQIFAKKVEIPARPFLGLDDDDEAEIEAICGEWLIGEELG